MNKISLKDVQDSFNTNCSNRTDKIKIECETTHLEQRNNKLHCKDSPVYGLVKQSKENSSNLLKMKRKQKRKEDIKQGKIFINYHAFN